MNETSIEPFMRAHLDGLISLVAAEGWIEYTEDPGRTYRAPTAPGVTTLIALDEERGVGAIQVQSDGVQVTRLSPHARGLGTWGVSRRDLTSYVLVTARSPMHHIATSEPDPALGRPG